MMKPMIIGWKLLGLLSVVVMFLASQTAFASPPYRGSAPISVLLCKFSDSGTPVHNAEYYRDMFIRRGTNGVADYLDKVSYGSINLNGSVVKGWYTIPRTESNTYPRNNGRDCVNAARNSRNNRYIPPDDHFIITMYYVRNTTERDASGNIRLVPDPSGCGGYDLYGFYGGAVMDCRTNLTYALHEIGHAFGLQHSFSNDERYRNSIYARQKEYDDPWDLMSAGHVFRYNAGRFGNGPAGLNAYHLDQMGWLPRNRIVTVGAFDSRGSKVHRITLAALNHPEARGAFLLRVPFDSSDPFHYYTVEYRAKDGIDAGIPDDTVLVHNIKKFSEPVLYTPTDGRAPHREQVSDNYYSTFLLRNFPHDGRGDPTHADPRSNRAPLLQFSKNGIDFRVISINHSTHQATIVIDRRNAHFRCREGFVWREAGQDDQVCVTPQVRTQVRRDNQDTRSRQIPGNDRCRSGFVWRDAFPGDHVCVTPQVRTQALRDNAMANSRVIGPDKNVYGPNTCKRGFVWREADTRDWVCVTPQVRTQVRSDNQNAQSRQMPGSDRCRAGFVWRDAFPGDHVCANPRIRTQARRDNDQATSRLETRPDR